MATTVAHNTGPAAVQPSADPRSSGQTKARSRTTIPTQSGKWILGKTIGAGSMGKVKLAKKEDSNEQVACKIIPRGSADDSHHSRADKERNEQGKEIRTAREAAIVTLLNHPYICGLRDVVRTNYHWYMLFEYVNGGQMLDYIISHGKLKEKQARKFSRQITSALDYCHRNSIVHRDLKIENILISKTGDIKIIDFGLSNLFSPRGHLKTFCGSLYFAAPELLQARAYTGPEVDVWSFGIVLYVLVCGKVPFDDQSMPALHAKIKKGLVDYPNWLSGECKNLLSRMLVTDPKQRATMAEVMTHPWMNKGYSSPPDNFLPRREPLTLPLDPEVINAMTGFNFGPPDVIKSQLTRLIESEEYQRGARAFQQEKDLPQPARDGDKKRGMFDFYKRRNSMNSRDTLTAPSSEALGLGNDPLNAFSPLLSIYYLVKEKQDRERVDNVVPTMSAQPPAQKEKDPMPEIAPPQEAHTNASAYEMPGEKATGGRSRPRARTHGEDEAPDKALLSPKAALGTEAQADRPEKKESAAAGILRRFSTRRRPKEPERLDKDRSHPPQVQVHSPSEHPPVPGIPARKSFSIRRSRRDNDGSNSQIRSGSSQPQHSDLLSPPISAGGNTTGQKKVLGRSTSVNSAEFRRRRNMGSGTEVKDPPATSGSDHSTDRERPRPQGENRGAMSSRSVSMRAKSLGHARRESIQARRARREEQREANVPEETDAELGDTSGLSNERLDNSDLAKPVFLKGLFSVSTTSTKPVPEIRADIKRVLKQLGVDYTEIRGGFRCVRAPSIDLKKVEPPNSPGQHPGHRRRFSFGLRGEKAEDVRDIMEGAQPNTPRTPGRPREDRSGSNSDVSDIDTSQPAGPSRRPPGETTTRVQDDLGGNMVLEFEVFIVKVPMISLHGIQFKRMAGNTWQFKNMADHILKELRFRGEQLANHARTNEAFDSVRRNTSAVSPSAKLSAPQDPSRARSLSQVGRSHLHPRRVVDLALTLGGPDHDLTADDDHHDDRDDGVKTNNSDSNEDPEVARQQFPPPQYPISEASGDTATSLISYRTAPPPFSSLFAGCPPPTDQPHGSAEPHGPPCSEIEQDHDLYDIEETGSPRERSLPAPAYEPPASSSSASTTTAYHHPLASETKRALPQDTKGESSSRAKDDDAEPPPAYSEGYSPLQSFSYLMAAAGGASSIITQVQQGGPPINTLGDVGADETITMDLRGTRFVLSRDELLTLPEFVLLSLFPNGLFPEGHMGGAGEGDAVQVDYDPESLQYMLDFFRKVASSIPSESSPPASQDGDTMPIEPLVGGGRDESSKRAGIIVLREDLDFYVIPPKSGIQQQEMIEVKRAAARALLKQDGIFSGLKRSDEPGTTEAHLIEMLTAGGFNHDDRWGHRAGEPHKAVVCSLALARLRSDIRGNEMGNNAVGMAQKLLLFWRKPARRCWWEGVELDDVEGVEGKLKVWIRRVWTLEMSVIGLR